MPPKDERTSRWQACFGETTDWEEDSEGEGFWFKSPCKITTKNPMGHWWLARGQIENVKAGRGLGKGRSGGYATEIGFVKGSDQIVFKGFQGGGMGGGGAGKDDHMGAGKGHGQGGGVGGGGAVMAPRRSKALGGFAERMAAAKAGGRAGKTTPTLGQVLAAGVTARAHGGGSATLPASDIGMGSGGGGGTMDYSRTSSTGSFEDIPDAHKGNGKGAASSNDDGGMAVATSDVEIASSGGECEGKGAFHSYAGKLVAKGKGKIAQLQYVQSEVKRLVKYIDDMEDAHSPEEARAAMEMDLVALRVSAMHAIANRM